jgi:hypothetical protein
MTDRIGASHQVLLWGALLLLTALGLAFLFIPDVLLDRLGIETSEQANATFRVASSVLIAEALIVGLALRSGLWSQTRYVTYLLAIHFTIETVIRITVFAMGESSSLVAAIPQALIAAGLLYVIYRRRETSVRMAAA